jgi:signal transduction histidine kinase
MRLPQLLQLLRSRALRLALLYAGLFGISITALLGFIYLIAGNYVKSHVDEFVVSELEMLIADYEIDGLGGVTGLINSRDASDRNNHWLYLFVDASGKHLAGDSDAWPKATPGPDGFLTLPARKGAGTIRARSAHFPDGSQILVGLNDYEVGEMRSALARSMGFGLGAMLLLAIGGGVLVTLATLRQIESINRVTHDIMAGDLKQRVPVGDSADEFDALGRNINAMLDRIGTLMEAVRGVTDNIAHDLRLPLARLRARLEASLSDGGNRDDLERAIGHSIDEVDSILLTFGALLRIANVESGRLRESFTDVDLSRIALDAEQLFEPIASAGDKTLAIAIEHDVHVEGSRDLLFQALANLIDNALKYTPEHGRILIELTTRGDVVHLVVADNGPGVAPDQREKVFQRLYRVDPSRSTAGNGLGLSLVRAVALLHDGSCEIGDNEPGARVVLRLPLRGIV